MSLNAAGLQEKDLLDQLTLVAPSASRTARTSGDSDLLSQDSRLSLTEDYLSTMADLEEEVVNKAGNDVEALQQWLISTPPLAGGPEVFVISTPSDVESFYAETVQGNEWADRQASSHAGAVRERSLNQFPTSAPAACAATPTRNEVVFQPVIPNHSSTGSTPIRINGTQCAVPTTTPTGPKRPWPFRSASRDGGRQETSLPQADQGKGPPAATAQSFADRVGKAALTPVRLPEPALQSSLTTGTDTPPRASPRASSASCSSGSGARQSGSDGKEGAGEQHSGASTSTTAAWCPTSARSAPGTDGNEDYAAEQLRGQICRLESVLEGLDAEVRRILETERGTKLRVESLEANKESMDARLAEVCFRLPSLADLQEAPWVSKAQHSVGERLGMLERGQKTMAESLRRAWHTAIASQEESHAASERLVEGLDATPRETMQETLRRLDEHERRIAALDAVTAVTALELRAPRRSCVDSQCSCSFGEGGMLKTSAAGFVNSGCDDAEVAGGAGVMDLTQSSSEDWALLAQNLEAQVTQSLSQVRDRMDAMQDMIDQKVMLKLWELGRQIPEAVDSVERLAAQCQDSFAKVEAHEVRLSMMTTSFEMQDTKLQALSERCDRAASAEVSVPSSARCQPSRVGMEALEGRLDSHAQALEDLRSNMQELKARAFVRGLWNGQSTAASSPQASLPGTPRLRAPGALHPSVPGIALRGEGFRMQGSHPPAMSPSQNSQATQCLSARSSREASARATASNEMIPSRSDQAAAPTFLESCFIPLPTDLQLDPPAASLKMHVSNAMEIGNLSSPRPGDRFPT